MTAQRTVLAIGPVPPPINGMSKAFDMLVQNLPSYGWNVRTVDSADRTPPRIASAFSFARASTMARVLGRACLALPKVDVVYVAIAQSRWGFAKDVIVLNASSALGRPVVAHMHGGNFAGFYRSVTRLEQRIVRSTLDRLSRIVVLTDGLKQDFWMTRHWPQRTVAVSNTCDVPLGQPRRLQPGVLRVLYLSNLVVSKGYRDVVLAVSQLAAQRPELRIRLELAGALIPLDDFADASAQRNDLEKMLEQLPASVTATCHGVVDGMRKEQLLQDSDVLVLPTWYRNEGQPIAVLEALTSGLPVIATNWRGIQESLPTEMLTLLVPPKDPTAISGRLAYLADHPDTYARLSLAAVERAELFRQDRHLAALDTVLRSALVPETASAAQYT
jgi:glycosyltransferase involved in cell wall biosynthesis